MTEIREYNGAQLSKELRFKLFYCGSAVLDSSLGGNFGKIQIDSVEIENHDAPLVKVYGEVGEIKAQNLGGVNELYTVTDEEFEADPI